MNFPISRYCIPLLILLALALMTPAAAQQPPTEVLRIGFYGPSESRAARALELAITQIDREGGFASPSGARYLFEGMYSTDPADLRDTLAVLALPDQPEAVAGWEMPVFLLDATAPLSLPGAETDIYRGMSSADHQRAMLARFLTEQGGVQRAYVMGAAAQPFAADLLAQALVQVRQRENTVLTGEDFAAVLDFNPQAIVFSGDLASAQGLLTALGGRGWGGYFVYADARAIEDVPPGVTLLWATSWAPQSTDALSAAFVADYGVFTGGVPDARAVAAYDLAWVLRLMVTRGSPTPLDLRLNLPTTADIRSVQGRFNPAVYPPGEVYQTAHILNGEARVLARYDGGVLQDLSPEVVALATATPQPSPTPARPTFTVTGATLNIRQGPDEAYAVIGQLDNDDRVGVLARLESNDWYLVETPFGLGWVRADLGTLFAPEGAALQVIDPPPPPTATPPPPPTPAPTLDNVVNPAQTLQAGGQVTVPSGPPRSDFGLGGHVFSQDAAGVMQSIGMTWLKQQVRWERGETPANGAGPAIEGARARGMRILIGSVGWPREMDDLNGYMDEYAAYLGQVAALGPDAIEVWNEPNLSREWPLGRVDGATYTDMLRRAYTAIKAANPNVMVISGAPAPTGFFSGGCTSQGCDDDVFLRQMVNAGALQYMDCQGVHFNEGTISPGQVSGDPRGDHHSYYLLDLLALYDQITGAAVPLCITEFGYLTDEGLPPLPPGFEWAADTTAAQHAAWLAEAVTIGRLSGRVRLMIVWNIDFTSYGADPRAGYAILRPDGSCPACQTLQNALR